MASGIHTEHTFESAIEESLINQGGYRKGNSTDFDVNLGLFPSYITDFLKTSQPKEWAKISAIHKNDIEKKVLDRLLKELDLRGTLDVIRNGFTDYGVKFKMGYLKPESTLNTSAAKLYDSNQLTVTRQLYYERKGNNSLDMVLSLNDCLLQPSNLKINLLVRILVTLKSNMFMIGNPTSPSFNLRNERWSISL
ncbi:hypothetical protein [Pedobacter mucosus]|uniref:hypothetical protein n=1 Tax=Pedobacter mucosus TaxID=2895286 RepID=UPI001EE3EAF6|nr:hypothetical protein [Pedobacter mucosus]UKT65821.1 hypothetical protein LOK61_08520 [Pedobacter mucosus]